jgi:VIT1/CCC1 family predicted Fe2+/Mn2+ transporter
MQMKNKAVDKDSSTQRESFSELLGRLANQSAAVVRHEIELITRGIREKAAASRSGVLALLAGAFIGFAAFLALCTALIIGLTSYMSPGMAALVTGAALAFIGVVIAFIGYKQVRKSIPER